jgi:hypothetical protein
VGNNKLFLSRGEAEAKEEKEKRVLSVTGSRTKGRKKKRSQNKTSEKLRSAGEARPGSFLFDTWEKETRN